MASVNLFNVDDLSYRGQHVLGQEMFKVLDRAQILADQGHTIFHLELGNPRHTPPDKVIDAAMESIKNLDLGYTSAAGHPTLRKAIAQHYAERRGCNLGMKNIAVSPANFLISQFLDLTCNRGDRVVLFTPAFPSYIAATQYMGLDTLNVPLLEENNYLLTEADVDTAMAYKPKSILVNSANNPTGAIYEKKVMDYLVKRCGDAGVWLLSDETYADICYGKDFYSLAGEPLPHLVVVSSFSKVFSVPGFRIGYALAHPDMIEKIALLTSTLISCLPIFNQLGCVAGLPELDEYTLNLRSVVKDTMAVCVDQISACDQLSCALPPSSFYIFVNIEKTGLNDMEFTNILLENHHVAVTPGRSFGAGSNSHVRVAICGEKKNVFEGVSRMVHFANSTKTT